MRKMLMAAAAAALIPAALTAARAGTIVGVAYGYGPPPGVITRHYAWRPAPVAYTIENLSDDVLNSASLVRSYSEQGRYRTNWREARAIRDLYALEQAARDFHDRAELATRQPLATDYEFQRLATAYQYASRTFGDLRPYGPVTATWIRLTDGMDRLANLLGYPAVSYRGGYGDGYRNDTTWNRGDRGRGWDHDGDGDHDGNGDRD